MKIGRIPVIEHLSVKLWLAKFGIAKPGIAFLAVIMSFPGYSVESVRLRGLSLAGSGCPAGSVSAGISSDDGTLELSFAQFVAEVGPGIPLAKSRRFCNLTFILEVPSNQQYAIRDVSYSGYAYLEPKAGVDLKSSFFFAGRPQEVLLEKTVRGSYYGDFAYQALVPESSLLWSECGGDKLAALTTSVRVYAERGSQARGQVSTDLLGIKQRYALVYREC